MGVLTTHPILSMLLTHTTSGPPVRKQTLDKHLNVLTNTRLLLVLVYRTAQKYISVILIVLSFIRSLTPHSK